MNSEIERLKEVIQKIEDRETVLGERPFPPSQEENELRRMLADRLVDEERNRK